MELQQNFKCKTCGQPLDDLVEEATNGLVECPSCYNKWTIPRKETSPAALQFLRMGEHDLDVGKFDDAFSAYQKAAQLDETEPEAYFGMALAEFKIQYIKDVVENCLQPISHEFTEKQFVKNKNYLRALSLATEKQKEEYQKKAQEIDDICREFLELKQSGLDYDCFICVKVSRTDEEQTETAEKNWTDDAYRADAIYDLLKRNGYTPFFSEREIKGRTGVRYGAFILYALYTSETMLVVCSDEEYLKTPWVKNEYSRFKELMHNREKESNSLTIVFNKTPVEKLPGFSGKIQGIDYDRREADFEIVKFVEEHTPRARAKREEEKNRKSEEAEHLQNEINKLKSKMASGNETVGSILERADYELSIGDFAQARNHYDKVLNIDSKNVNAWWGLFLVENKVKYADEIFDKLTYDDVGRIQSNKNYTSALRFDTDKSHVKLQNFRQQFNSPYVWWKAFLSEMGVSDYHQIIDRINTANYSDVLEQINQNKCYSKLKELTGPQPELRCKTCGQSLEELVAEASNGIVECPFCYNKWTIPAALQVPFADRNFTLLEQFQSELEAKIKEVKGQIMKQEFAVASARRKFRNQKIILTAVSIACLLVGFIIVVSTVGIGASGSGFLVLLAILVGFGGLGGMIAYLVYSIIALWRCTRLNAKIIFKVVLNFLLPFVYCGLMLLFNL